MVRHTMRVAAVILAGAAIALATRYDAPEARGKEGGGAITIVLKKEFIKKHKHKVTIDVDMKVDAVGKIHSAKKDGELHFSGRAEQVGLPFVAELMNAKDQAATVKALKKAEGKDAIKLSGAWRLWCEHADASTQTQGMSLPDPFPDSNPAHVFEIHPVTKVGDDDVIDSIGSIDGFTYKKAEEAFTHYENVACKIKDNVADGTVTIRTSMAGYNIPEFILENVDPDLGGKKVEDGRFLFATVRDLEGELLIRKVRMAFIKGTEAEKKAQTLAKGGRMRVVGIPRISLALINFRIENKDDDREPLTWNLPYEIIVVGVVGDDD